MVPGLSPVTVIELAKFLRRRGAWRVTTKTVMMFQLDDAASRCEAPAPKPLVDLRVPRKPDAGELPAGLGRKEVAIGRPDMILRCGT